MTKKLFEKFDMLYCKRKYKLPAHNNGLKEIWNMIEDQKIFSKTVVKRIICLTSGTNMAIPGLFLFNQGQTFLEIRRYFSGIEA